MTRYSAGDAGAFQEVYDTVAPRLMGYLRRHVRDDNLAADLLQHTFLRLHRARGSFARGAAVLPWSFAIARRLVIDGVRRSRHEPVSLAEAMPYLESISSVDGDGESQLRARELAERLARVLGALPENQRTAFELLRIDGLSVAEAAEVLGTTSTAVKLRAHRAYEALRTVMAEPKERE